MRRKIFHTESKEKAGMKKSHLGLFLLLQILECLITTPRKVSSIFWT